MRRATVLAGVVLALGLSACGASTSGSSTVTTTPATTAAAAATTTAAELVAPSTDRPAGSAKTLGEARAAVAAESGLSDEQAGCVVDKLAAAVGEDKAIELTNDPREIEELPAGDSKAVLDSVLSCVTKEDMAAMISESFYTDLKDSGVTEAHAECVGTKLMEVVTPETLYKMGASQDSFEALDPADQGKMFQAVIDCVPPEVMGRLAADNGATTTMG